MDNRKPRPGWDFNSATKKWTPVPPEPSEPPIELTEDVEARTPEQMRDEILRITNRQLAGLSKQAIGKTLGDGALKQLTIVNSIVMQHLRAIDPLDRRDGETEEAYKTRLEAMR